MYDFDISYPRNQKGSYKWDGAEKAGCPEGITPFTVADMEFRSAPEIVKALKETAEFGLWGYTYGDEEYKKAVAGWMKRRHGWQADPEWIVSTGGVIPGLYTAIRAFTRPGDRVIIQTPVYGPFGAAVENTGRLVLDNQLIERQGAYSIDFEDLRRKAPLAKMMILCSPHNPVGRVWSEDELAQVAEICYENKVLLFSDEIHGDLILPPHRHFCAGRLAQKYLSNIVIATAASKTFSLAGLGCASMFIPDANMRETYIKQMAEQGDFFNTTFGVAATQAACEKGEPWLEDLLVYLAQNLAYLNQFFKEKFPGVKIADLQGTYLAWLDMRSFGRSEKEMQDFLQEKAQLYLSPGSSFGKAGEGYFRMNLACPRTVLAQALERLEKAAAEEGLQG